MMNYDKDGDDNNTTKMTTLIEWEIQNFQKNVIRQKCVRLLVGNPDENFEITRPQIGLQNNNNNKCARFEVLTAVLTKINLFWVVTSY